ncbi:benzoate/H(+) symporter BenE family transporter [Ruegeria pomeroyi]|uniref:Benzoate transporter n=2 Tax=Ruegeria pomeroyi TaxID=89184 RepID=Q5LN34_RUEPO|nr:benzoate/H(+) symporter BenE family transporter [Ruegeria pomeroyi]AAV96605.1 benzoate transporter [Ruegeria pomeroyi DSS-3]NVK96197.1 benzoate/H(+) symporter BenE family transporter [Ruegeria pomeroyi]NVL03629.1 benzoate/H(+) symporter BenE family transporter [Ruegeria pomeroyi]QWV10144.1 benzoate/H(+) symporter BenE family transporter [Ruegeria pomeroyi]
MTVRPPLQTVSTGLVVAIVGFFGSFPIVLQGLTGVGADAAQAASGLMFAALSMGISGILLSLWTKAPVSVAWSTPGAALLAVSTLPQDGFGGAVAGFIMAGALTVIAAWWRPLSRLTAAIPGPIAQAMLAGVLFALCLRPFQALAEIPLLALPILLTWFIASQISRPFAVPAAVIAGALVVTVNAGFDIPAPEAIFAAPVWVTPVFSLEALTNIALPLFIVTMATQNVPGLAVLRAYGYQPRPAPLVAGVGAASVLSAPFGSPATCLAAITAAMCANEESHPDPTQRYWSAVMGGLFYCLLGLFAGVITGFAALAPALVLGTVAGVALLGVFAGSALAALEDPDCRQAAAVTFLITASGVTILGLSAAVWGLVIGGLMQMISSRIRRART